MVFILPMLLTVLYWTSLILLKIRFLLFINLWLLTLQKVYILSSKISLLLVIVISMVIFWYVLKLIIMTLTDRYLYSICHNPKTIRVYDVYSQSFVKKQLPCGECPHCRFTKVNEWVTRMYAEAKYNQNVYFVSLDYSPFDWNNSIGKQLARDTYADMHNICKTHHYALHPLLLCKEHLQKFHKRLRKQGFNYHYFECGEYGHFYGRPHYHLIIFTNDTISNECFESAWTIDGYLIGRVDCHNLVENGSFLEHDISVNKLNAKNSFKYVCKYLQKGSFQFANLPTLEFVKKQFPEIQEVIAFQAKSSDKTEKVESFLSRFAPFCLSSKRPALGYKYFSENVERFQRQDFRLFGLSRQCAVFPSYFGRKTKESLCRWQCFNQKDDKPSSSARLYSLVSTLAAVHSDNIALTEQNLAFGTTWNISSAGHYFGRIGDINPLDKRRYMDLYDSKEHAFYRFVGYGYKEFRKYRGLGIVDTDTFIPIPDMLEKVVPELLNYWNYWVLPMKEKNDIYLKRKEEFIEVNYSGSKELYEAALADYLDAFKRKLHLQQMQYNAEKQVF